MFSSLVTGLLIGAEREFRDKSAGLRTHTLVCFASTLLMLAATRQDEWLADFIPGADIVVDPTRMAHGVLAGIGFLCAGVIFREGPSVHGLTTAASLWITSALGLLFGVGMYGLVVSGAAATLVVLVLFRVFYLLFPEWIKAAVEVRCTPGSAFGAADFRRLLDRNGFRATPIAQRLRPEGGEVSLATHATLRGPVECERLGDLLGAVAGVESFQIVPTEEIAPHARHWR